MVRFRSTKVNNAYIDCSNFEELHAYKNDDGTYNVTGKWGSQDNEKQTRFQNVHIDIISDVEPPIMTYKFDATENQNNKNTVTFYMTVEEEEDDDNEQI